jgi:hypothetical protein
MNKKLKAVLNSYLTDIASDDPVIFYGVFKAVSDQRTQVLLEEAGCPKELLDAMLDTLPLSTVERRHVVGKLKERIKKAPDIGVPGANL